MLYDIITSTNPTTVLSSISKLPYDLSLIGKAANLFTYVIQNRENSDHIEKFVKLGNLQTISNIMVILSTVTKTDRALSELSKRIKHHTHFLYIKKILLHTNDPDATFKNVMMILDELPNILMPLNNALDYITDCDYFIGQLRRAIQHNPDIDWNSALSNGQMRSKFWAIAELKKLNISLGNTLFVGGWVNILSYLLEQEGIYPDDIISLDIDPTVGRLATLINMKMVLDGWKFKAVTYDMMKLTYDDKLPFTNYNGKSRMLSSTPTTIINLSCEHIDIHKWANDIPGGMQVILQSNNFDELSEHISCVNSIETFKNILGLSTILYAGELKLEKYTRFMVIGIK